MGIEKRRRYSVTFRERPLLGIVGNLLAPSGGSWYVVEVSNELHQTITLARRGDVGDAKALAARIERELSQTGTITVDSRLTINPFRARTIRRFFEDVDR